MKIFFLSLVLAFSVNCYSESSWLPAGTMSQGNTDWVYAIASNHTGNLFASSWAVGIYKGQGSGQQWAFSGLTGKRVSNIFAAPNGDLFGYSHTSSIAYIHRSTDNGVTWTDVYTRNFANNYAGGGGMVFPSDGSIVASFAVTVGPTVGDVASYIFKSTDGGNNWVQKAVIQSGFVGGMELLADGRIFIGTSLSGVKMSTNNGENWVNMNTFPPIYIDNILKDKDNVIYICDAYGPNRSTDNGQTFVPVSPLNSGVMTEASFVDSRGDFYISYNHNNIYRSTNKGDTWQLINNGLSSNTYICSFTEANGKVYAGTNNSGAFYFVPDVTAISNSSESAVNFRLIQNYPNPFNPSTKISFSIEKSSFVNLSVFDVSGKLVSSLINENKPAGNYNINFDASNLAGGVYFYRLSADGFTQTKKMILTK